MTTELTTKNAKAVIASEGAELKSLVIGGREIMWCGDPAFWGKTSPVLFPAIGNVKNNKTIIDGKEISLTKHGFARDNTFTTVRKKQQLAHSAVQSTHTAKKTAILIASSLAYSTICLTTG